MGQSMGEPAVKRTEAANDSQCSEDPNFSFKVEERLSQELIIALVGPVASGVSTAADLISKILTSEYDYTVETIKVSPLIKDRADEVGEDIPDSLQGDKRIEKYQLVGNKLRDVKGEKYLADCVIERIALARQRNDGFYPSDNGTPEVPKQLRLAYIVDSLKNPAEVARLRQIYGDLLWVITVFAPHEVRKRRLCSAGGDDISAQQVMKRDQQDDDDYGQQVSRTAHRADFFIRNHLDTRARLKSSIERFLEVIFGIGLHTPTFEEEGMMKAAAAAIQSACLSRQVGAAIYNANNELIGVGCNDVPKFGGGLYTAPDGDADKRCYRWGGQVCHNDERKAKLARSIANAVSQKPDNGQVLFSRVYEAASKSDARNLIEFSRSVHAEMEAIVSVAREGKGATANGTLFTTTYPCHNCARHIVAAGITRVVFIEPYSKSLALDLHNDSISESDEPDHVHFQQYEGFSPRSALRVFSSTDRDRKSGGKIVESNPRVANLLFPTPLDSYISSEGLVIKQLSGG
jgi:deoxycytidylate deaminase